MIDSDKNNACNRFSINWILSRHEEAGHFTGNENNSLDMIRVDSSFSSSVHMQSRSTCNGGNLDSITGNVNKNPASNVQSSATVQPTSLQAVSNADVCRDYLRNSLCKRADGGAKRTQTDNSFMPSSNEVQQLHVYPPQHSSPLHLSDAVGNFPTYQMADDAICCLSSQRRHRVSRSNKIIPVYAMEHATASMGAVQSLATLSMGSSTFAGSNSAETTNSTAAAADMINVNQQIDGADDGNRYIDANVLKAGLTVVGCKIVQNKLRVMVDEMDADRDGRLSFDEFDALRRKLNPTDITGTFGPTLMRGGIESHASSEDTNHSSVQLEEEQVAFSNWINRNLDRDPDCKHLLPIDEDGTQLYEKVADGILLCKLINVACPGTIDERAINKTSLFSLRTRHENWTLAVNSAQSIGCNITNIDVDDLIVKGEPHLISGLLWQIIRIGLFNQITLEQCPGMIWLLRNGEKIENLMRLAPEQILLRWANYHLEAAGIERRMNNFTSDVKDSEIYTHLLHQLAKNGEADLSPLQKRDMLRRAELMLKMADKMKCRSFVTRARDVVEGIHKLNVAFVANLFNTHPPGLPPLSEEALLKLNQTVSDVKETRKEKTYRNWLNSLGVVHPFAHHLSYTDLSDGLIIFQVYDIIKPGIVDWNQVVRKCNRLRASSVEDTEENCNYAVQLGKELSFSLADTAGQDISQGNSTSTMALVWQLMRAYTLSILTSSAGGTNPTAENEIIGWVNSKLKASNKSSEINDFQDPSLSSAMPIIDLIDAITPESIRYDRVNPTAVSHDDCVANAKYAISIARKCGARGMYALPEDIVECEPNMVMTVFACLMGLDYKRTSMDLKQQQKTTPISEVASNFSTSPSYSVSKFSNPDAGRALSPSASATSNGIVSKATPEVAAVSATRQLIQGVVHSAAGNDAKMLAGTVAAQFVADGASRHETPTPNRRDGPPLVQSQLPRTSNYAGAGLESSGGLSDMPTAGSEALRPQQFQAFNRRHLLHNKRRSRSAVLLSSSSSLLLDTDYGERSGGVEFQANSEGNTYSVRLKAQVAFPNWINSNQSGDADCKHLLSMDEDDTQLYEKVADGILMCKLINLACPDTIDERAINKKNLNDHTRHENLTLAVNSAQSIGCNITNIDADDLSKAKPHSVLGLLRQIITGLPLSEEMLPTVEQETREEKTCRNWLNSLGVNPFVHDLYTDLSDGLIIFQLYDIIQPGIVDWNKVVTLRKFNNRLSLRLIEKLENCNYAVQLGKELSFSLAGIAGKDISQGNPISTMALVWQLMRAYTLSILTSSAGGTSPIAEKEIIAWVNSKLKASNKSSEINSCQDSSLSNAMPVIDLIDAIKPGSIRYDQVNPTAVSHDDCVANATYAISIARKCGARAMYALPEDIVECKPNMIMTVFACLMGLDYKRASMDSKQQQKTTPISEVASNFLTPPSSVESKSSNTSLTKNLAESVTNTDGITNTRNITPQYPYAETNSTTPSRIAAEIAATTMIEIVVTETRAASKRLTPILTKHDDSDLSSTRNSSSPYIDRSSAQHHHHAGGNFDNSSGAGHDNVVVGNSASSVDEEISTSSSADDDRIEPMTQSSVGNHRRIASVAECVGDSRDGETATRREPKRQHDEVELEQREKVKSIRAPTAWHGHQSVTDRTPFASDAAPNRSSLSDASTGDDGNLLNSAFDGPSLYDVGVVLSQDLFVGSSSSDSEAEDLEDSSGWRASSNERCLRDDELSNNGSEGARVSAYSEASQAMKTPSFTRSTQKRIAASEASRKSGTAKTSVKIARADCKQQVRRSRRTTAAVRQNAENGAKHNLQRSTCSAKNRYVNRLTAVTKLLPNISKTTNRVNAKQQELNSCRTTATVRDAGNDRNDLQFLGYRDGNSEYSDKCNVITPNKDIIAFISKRTQIKYYKCQKCYAKKQVHLWDVEDHFEHCHSGGAGTTLKCRRSSRCLAKFATDWSLHAHEAKHNRDYEEEGLRLADFKFDPRTNESTCQGYEEYEVSERSIEVNEVSYRRKETKTPATFVFSPYKKKRKVPPSTDRTLRSCGPRDVGRFAVGAQNKPQRT